MRRAMCVCMSNGRAARERAANVKRIGILYGHGHICRDNIKYEYVSMPHDIADDG